MMSAKTRRPLLGLLAAVLSVALLPTPAPVYATDAPPSQPEQVYKITGGGNAHGVGMSQRGARARAVAGQDHEAILSFYFSDHPIATLDTSETDIRVLLATDTVPTDKKPVRITGRVTGWTSELFEVYEQPFPVNSYLDVVADGVGGWVANVFDSAGILLDSAPLVSSVFVEPVDETTQFEMNYRDNIPRHNLNRGRIRIRVMPSGLLQTINILNLETYLRGVVACEMPSSYPVEALRAQAVASRGYAMTKIKSTGVFDIHSYRINQVYGGVNCETTKTNKAVADTAGKVVLDNKGNPAETIFHDTAGGATESSEFAWPSDSGVPGSKKSYLKGRIDVDPDGVPYEAGAPSLSWAAGEVSHSELSAILSQSSKTNVGQLISFEFKRGVSGRVYQAVLTGSAGTKSVSGAVFKNVYDKNTSGPTLRSTMYFFTPTYDFSVPTVPQNLKATVRDDDSVEVSWDHSVGLGPMTYSVFRNGTASTDRVADDLTAPTFIDQPGPGTHSYTVRARDVAGTLSDLSAQVSVTVVEKPVADTTPPTVPQDVVAVARDGRYVDLSWSASTDDRAGPITYRVFRNGTGSAYRIADNLSATSFTDRPAAGTHYYTVRARDAAGNLSDFSATVTVTAADWVSLDTTPPTVPQDVVAVARDDRYVDLSWSASTDDRAGPITYRVFRNGTGSAYRIADNLSATSFTDRPAAGTHYYTVRARDAAGNLSDFSLKVNVTAVTSLNVDNTPPVVTGPTIGLRSGVAVGTGGTPVKARATFTATDPSGLRSTDLQGRTNAGSYSKVALPSTTATNANVKFATHETATRQLRARATDKVGNVSDWVVGQAFRVMARQDGASGVSQSGSWKSASNSKFYGGSVRHSSAAGARQSWTVTANSFGVVSTLGPKRGRAEVWVDGVKVATLDLYASSTKQRRVVYAVDFGSAAKRTIELRVLGTKNSKSSGTRVDFDAFIAIAP